MDTSYIIPEPIKYLESSKKVIKPREHSLKQTKPLDRRFTNIERLMTPNLSRIWLGALIGRPSSFIIFFRYCLLVTDKEQKATKLKCKHDESITKQSIFVEYIPL